MQRHSASVFALLALCAACSGPTRIPPRDAQADDAATDAAQDSAVGRDAAAADSGVDSAAPRDAAANDVADAGMCPMIVGDDGTGLFPATCSCIPNTTRACSLVPRESAGVGACSRGVQRCLGTGEVGRWSATCEGAGTPSAESCGNMIDEDCDGMTDEGCGCTVGATMSCYSGAAGTAGVGACRNGTRTCTAGPPAAFGPCAGEVVPVTEVCSNGVDDDCDGTTDEGCTTMGPTCAMGPMVENASGRYIVVANYDGGRATIDVDRAVEFVGVLAYEPIEVVFTGAFASGIRRVHIVGYNSMSAVVTGVAPAIVERAGMPAATLSDPAGYPRMVCASTCVGMPGGCNTLNQVLHYFDNTFSAARMWWHLQYSSFTGVSFAASRGGCCGS